MALHLASLPNRGFKQLGDDVLLFTFVSLVLLFVPDALIFTKLCLKSTAIHYCVFVPARFLTNKRS